MSVSNCAICSRKITPKCYFDEHHLIPKSKNGKYTDKILIHRICHDKIHSVWKESELANYYHTVDRILSHPDMQKFVSWIEKKPPEFYVKTKKQKH